MNETHISKGYGYANSTRCHAHAYLMPHVLETLTKYSTDKSKRVFDLGCGNGSAASVLADAGYCVTGVDPSEDGIRVANNAYPEINLHLGSGYDRLYDRFGQFRVAMCLEVIEHIYAPRIFAATLIDLVEPGGTAIISTPYHGYLKNLALAVSGALDRHFTALWDHGHIKFWSVATLTELLLEAGFQDVRFRFAGRIFPFSKSMIAIATKPENQAST